MMQGHQLKIHPLHPGPHYPVHRQHLEPRTPQLGAHIAALQRRHGAEEDGGVGRREDQLVARDLRDDLCVGVRQQDAPLQERVPYRRGGAVVGCGGGYGS